MSTAMGVQSCKAPSTLWNVRSASVQPCFYCRCVARGIGPRRHRYTARTACGKAWAAPPSRPSDWTQVVPWARERFRAIVTQPGPLPLLQACMLVALEEEAAIEVHPELRQVMLQRKDLRVRTMAGASTWDTSRLDALAHQVRGALQLPPSQPGQEGPPARVSGSAALPVGLFEQDPHRVLRALNTVMFDWHGHGPCNRYGVPQDSLLSSVLERGLGSSTCLTILYAQVASRLGVELAARPLEEGRYWLLWPAGQPDLLNERQGGRLLIDAYGQGSLLSEAEVCELFGLKPSELWVPASPRQLLASLLADLRDTHWARAVSCSAVPAIMLPLSLQTALDNRVGMGGGNAHAMERALAAAEKITWLLPGDSRAQLTFALLQYHSRHWDDAWLELGLVLERARAQPPGELSTQELEQARVLLEKIRLQLLLGGPTTADE